MNGLLHSCLGRLLASEQGHEEVFPGVDGECSLQFTAPCYIGVVQFVARDSCPSLHRLPRLPRSTLQLQPVATHGRRLGTPELCHGGSRQAAA